MIETAVGLVSEKGVSALSLSEIARVMGINRTTVYYHFPSRDDLLAAVKSWSSEQLAKAAFDPTAPQSDRIDYITRFVLENPELIKLWIDDFISDGDIQTSYPHWDALVDGIGGTLSDEGIDAEVYCIMLLTSAFIAPRVFKAKICPTASVNAIVRRFRSEQLRVLERDGLLEV